MGYNLLQLCSCRVPYMIGSAQLPGAWRFITAPLSECFSRLPQLLAFALHNPMWTDRTALGNRGTFGFLDIDEGGEV